MLKRVIACLSFSLASGLLFAQTTDLGRADYMYLPFSKSDNSIQRYRAILQVPIPLDSEKKRLFVVGMEYRHSSIDIKDEEDVVAFGENDVSSIKEMKTYAGYVWTPKENWRIGVKAGMRIESDWQGKLISDDFIYEIGAYAIKDKTKDLEEGDKPYRLIFGLNYSTVPGRWYPLPIINYYKEFHPDWTYTLGVPKTNIRYYLNASHKDAVQAYASLDNLYSNIQQNFVPVSASQNSEGRTAESIQETIVMLGLGYEHFFTEKFLFYAYGSHSVYNSFVLEDGKGKKVYKINSQNSPYIRVGLKYKY